MRTWLPLALVLFSVAPAFAQDEAPEELTAADDEEARALFEAGALAFQNGRFERALEYFQRAYDLSHRTRLLFNIANVQERLRQDEAALDNFRQYLEAHPDADNAGFVRSRIEALESSTASSGDEGDVAPPATGGGGDPVPGIVLLSIGGALTLGSVGTVAWTVAADDLVARCNALIAAGEMCLNGADAVAERDAAIGVTVALATLGVAGIVVGSILLATAGEGESNTDPEVASVHCAASPLGLGCAGRF